MAFSTSPFGNMSGLRIHSDKTQAMIFGHKIWAEIPENDNLGFKLANKKVLRVTLTFDLVEMDMSFKDKYEAMENTF